MNYDHVKREVIGSVDHTQDGTAIALDHLPPLVRNDWHNDQRDALENLGTIQHESSPTVLERIARSLETLAGAVQPTTSATHAYLRVSDK